MGLVAAVAVESGSVAVTTAAVADATCAASLFPLRLLLFLYCFLLLFLPLQSFNRQYYLPDESVPGTHCARRKFRDSTSLLVGHASSYTAVHDA